MSEQKKTLLDIPTGIPFAYKQHDYDSDYFIIRLKQLEMEYLQDMGLTIINWFEKENTNEQKICICIITLLMQRGCKCGGK